MVNKMARKEEMSTNETQRVSTTKLIQSAIKTMTGEGTL